MSSAIAIEESAGTHPVTPGQILPTREQLGELLLELSRPEDALYEFEMSLKSFPHRFRSHLGGLYSGRLLGNQSKVMKHETILEEMTEGRLLRRGPLDQLLQSKELSMVIP